MSKDRRKADFARPLTTSQVAEVCGVSVVAVRKWIEADKLEAYRLPDRSHHRITPEALEEFLKRFAPPLLERWQALKEEVENIPPEEAGDGGTGA